MSKNRHDTKNESQNDYSYQVENYLRYYGDQTQVRKLMNECDSCGAKLIQTHLSDYSNLFVQENSRCPECGKDNRKVIHALN